LITVVFLDVWFWDLCLSSLDFLTRPDAKSHRHGPTAGSDTLPFEPHFQSFALAILEMGSHKLFIHAGLDPLTSQSQPHKYLGYSPEVSHPCLAMNQTLCKTCLVSILLHEKISKEDENTCFNWYLGCVFYFYKALILGAFLGGIGWLKIFVHLLYSGYLTKACFFVLLAALGLFVFCTEVWNQGLTLARQVTLTSWVTPSILFFVIGFMNYFPRLASNCLSFSWSE
jgi:hypothetical protein